MNKFLYLISILCFNIGINCFGDKHSAYAGFKFCNSSEAEISLQPDPESQEYTTEDFKEFVTQNVPPKSRISFEENLKKYEEVKNPEDSQVMLTINVVAKDGTNIGVISLIRGTSPDPCFSFKNLENNLGLKLHIQRSRFGGGGPRTIEFVHTADR